MIEIGGVIVAIFTAAGLMSAQTYSGSSLLMDKPAKPTIYCKLILTSYNML